jgi:hypothetical protein
LLAKSLLHTFDGQEFGTHDVGPITSPNARNDEIRAACFEFRCPGFIRNGSQEIFDLSTAIEVHLTTKEQKKCSFRYVVSYLFFLNENNENIKLCQVNQKKYLTYLIFDMLNNC